MDGLQRLLSPRPSSGGRAPAGRADAAAAAAAPGSASTFAGGPPRAPLAQTAQHDAAVRQQERRSSTDSVMVLQPPVMAGRGTAAVAAAPQAALVPGLSGWQQQQSSAAAAPEEQQAPRQRTPGRALAGLFSAVSRQDVGSLPQPVFSPAPAPAAPWPQHLAAALPASLQLQPAGSVGRLAATPQRPALPRQAAPSPAATRQAQHLLQNALACNPSLQVAAAATAVGRSHASLAAGALVPPSVQHMQLPVARPPQQAAPFLVDVRAILADVREEDEGGI